LRGWCPAVSFRAASLTSTFGLQMEGRGRGDLIVGRLNGRYRPWKGGWLGPLLDPGEHTGD